MARRQPAYKFQRVFEVGATVQIQDGFTGEIHTGTVTRVQELQNGYVNTWVTFPTKYEGERQWHPETLKTPDELQAMIAERDLLFPNNAYKEVR